ncbi:MAG: type II secretion system F family protein, partial [Candidatus Aenigmarchaeota archaeon]|nr:type II secretion system F family protein [Candidatus Aenigmarchaeota archaeon]
LLAFLTVIISIISHNPVFALFTSLIVSLISSFLTFMLYVYSPMSKVNSLGKKIDKELPFSLLSLSTFISEDVPIEESFNLFRKSNKDLLLAKEIGEIVDYVNYMGKDIYSAIETKIKYCPSQKLRDILWGMYSTMRSGGNLYEFLKEKSNEFVEEYRRNIKEFSRKVMVFIELYLLLIVMGSLFFNILTSIFSSLNQGGTGGNIVFLQFFLTAVTLPLVTVMMMFMIKSILPYEVE